MKSFIVFTCCLGLSLSVASAEQPKEGKGKRGQGKQAQVQSHGGGQAGKHANMNRQRVNNAGQSNAVHAGKGGGHRNFSAGGGGNVPAVQSQTRTGGKAQVKHFDFANARNSQIKSVTFKANRRIVGAERWQGERYVVFRNYRPLWHDRVWWVAHYPRIVLIGGGWYYWNAGFWYPAWGYEPTHAYYPYDGPIYGYNDLPPDQVVTNVQE